MKNPAEWKLRGSGDSKGPQVVKDNVNGPSTFHYSWWRLTFMSVNL